MVRNLRAKRHRGKRKRIALRELLECVAEENLSRLAMITRFHARRRAHRLRANDARVRHRRGVVTAARYRVPDAMNGELVREVPVTIPRDDEAQQLVHMSGLVYASCFKLKQVTAPGQDPLARGWFRLFKHMDDDGSGKVSFAEFEDLVRNELLLGGAELPEPSLKAVWVALDDDGSGFITVKEFGVFMLDGGASLQLLDFEPSSRRCRAAARQTLPRDHCLEPRAELLVSPRLAGPNLCGRPSSRSTSVVPASPRDLRAGIE